MKLCHTCKGKRHYLGMGGMPENCKVCGGQGFVPIDELKDQNIEAISKVSTKHKGKKNDNPSI